MLFGTTKLVRNTNKSKFIQNGWGIAFNAEGKWNFRNEFARNVVIFYIANTLSSQTYNQKYDFLVLDEGPTDGINDSTGEAEKNNISFSKAKTKLYLSIYLTFIHSHFVI